MATISWTPAILNKMKTLMERGLSTAEIGKKIGMSKNAVVGKLNRLGWNPKATGADVKKTSAKKEIKIRVKAPKKTPVKKTPAQIAITKKANSKVAAAPAKKKVSDKKNMAQHQNMIDHVMDMAMLRGDQCRWPIGNPDSDNFHFCGEKVFPGKPYCYEHCRASYQMMPPPKKK
ncbi:MAG: GcrA family cell cycle regulator [Rickettsiales bacterium]|jgi:GcrA cell cycle regulator|nr:GcrA family cell cycle regulator [Rickettsiales bacterium]